VPSPAFNRDDARLDRLQPLARGEPTLDHSFVGMNGGQIFHEMMLRHGVEHICTMHCHSHCPRETFA
jgi:acetolactate synthase-1/2/3 large subunit